MSYDGYAVKHHRVTPTYAKLATNKKSIRCLLLEVLAISVLKRAIKNKKQIRNDHTIAETVP